MWLNIQSGFDIVIAWTVDTGQNENFVWRDRSSREILHVTTWNICLKHFLSSDNYYYRARALIEEEVLISLIEQKIDRKRE